MYVLWKEEARTLCLYKVPVVGQTQGLVLLGTLSGLGETAPMTDRETESQKIREVLPEVTG